MSTTLEAFPEMEAQIIDIKMCGLRDIADFAFHKIDKLRDLILEKNSIKKIGGKSLSLGETV